jgi:hypothetical protein
MASESDLVIPSFDAVPEEALRVIMLALPVDARARAACVCRGWRAFWSDLSLWQVLDLTTAGGVDELRVTENLVCGAVARAAGRLRVLSFNDVPSLFVDTLLVRLITSDGAELQQVNTDIHFRVEDLDAVFAAAPLLQVLNAGVKGQCTELLPVLRNDPPYGPLRVSALDATFRGVVTDDDMFALAAAVEAHETLNVMNLALVRSARGLKALVDAAAERRVSCLTLTTCSLDAESVLALARLVQRGCLTKLGVTCQAFPRAHVASVPALCAALRSCRTLKHLSLRLDTLNGDHGANRPTGRALGALLSANLPSLRTLRVNRCLLSDEGLAPLLDGLAANTHLRTLQCRINDPSFDFERDRLAPALAALAARAELDAQRETER